MGEQIEIIGSSSLQRAPASSDPVLVLKEFSSGHNAQLLQLRVFCREPPPLETKLLLPLTLELFMKGWWRAPTTDVTSPKYCTLKLNIMWIWYDKHSDHHKWIWRGVFERGKTWENGQPWCAKILQLSSYQPWWNQFLGHDLPRELPGAGPGMIVKAMA